MENKIKTKVSAYVKGDEQTPEYYRIYQYLNRMQDIECRYHMMMSTWVYRRFMPVSKQSFIIKIFVYLHQYFRMLSALLSDCMAIPDVIVIHKRIISHFMPPSFKWLIKRLHKKGSRIIWDFDDHILETKEISKPTFYLFASLSSRIIVTHQFLADLVPVEFKDKITILPTTDGDMAIHVSQEGLSEQRLMSLQDSIRLIWVGTSYNLPHLHNILSKLDYAATQLAQNDQRKLILTVVCDKPLEVVTSSLTIINVKWSRDAAINELKNSHIGIMPLSDNMFNRGKGGFKLVQYLSMALPCIGSDIGFNTHVIDESCGILLHEGDEASWLNAITQIGDKSTWAGYSKAAISKWERDFSFTKNLNFWTATVTNK